jgi:plastocyanin
MKLRVLKAKAWFALAITISAACHANDMVVTVTDQKGKPLEGAVVYVTGAGSMSAESTTHVMNQKDEKFTPYVLAISKGDKVVFHNGDGIAHHVYSFSNALKLNTVIPGGNDSETFEITAPGIIAIGCNIHDNMAAFVHVAPNSNTAVTGPDGTVTIDVPDGSNMVSAWHHRMPKKEAISTSFEGSEASLTLRVRPDRGNPQERRRDRRKY